MDRQLRAAHLTPTDRSLVQELCYGTTRWRATLDWLIDRQTHEARTDPGARVLLRLGLYQLFWLDRVPDHAAVNETVEVTHALQLSSQRGFINAVLRNYARAADATRQLLKDLRTQQPALGWSHPEWLIERWRERLDPDALQRLLAWNNSPAPVYARVNTIKTDAARLLTRWREEGVDYDFGRWDWIDENQVFLLRRHPPLAHLTSFREGCFYIQDPSTLLAPRILAPQPGERILDLCAAPGGKAAMIAQTLDNDGEIIAVEPDEHRRARLQENCERLGADVVVAAPSARDTKGPFDAVLVDAPCSNTGVLRRRLDVRWRLNPDELARCVKLQRTLLESVLDRLRPGGRVVYSTCSLEPEENMEVVDHILGRHPELQLDQSRLLHPVRDGVDGAFVSLLRKSASNPVRP